MMGLISAASKNTGVRNGTVVVLLGAGLWGLGGCSDSDAPILRSRQSPVVETTVPPVESVEAPKSVSRAVEALSAATIMPSSLPSRAVSLTIEEKTVPYLGETPVSVPLPVSGGNISSAYPATDVEHLAPTPVIDWSLPHDNWVADSASDWSEGQSLQLHQGILQAFLVSSENEEESVEWSGRLHWDESEQGLEKPLMDSVTGAELEIRFRLP